MPILIDKSKRVLVQGITGREGIARTNLMINYGTQVLAGVTPGKGGQTVLGIPVFDTVREACDTVGQIDISVLFIPAPLVLGAALEAFAAGIKLLVIVPDRVPLYDVLEIAAVAKSCGAGFIGPNTLGILSPDAGVLGMMGGRAESAREWLFPGPVGITSRSGGITTSMAYYIAQSGIGLSTLAHVGGDSVVGTTHADMLRLFQKDEQTKLVVLFGEIGTSQEEEAADLIESGEFTKPLIAYIGGKAAKEGTRFSHAGAIVEGNKGTHQGKVRRLRDVGAVVAESFSDIPQLVADTLQALSSKTITHSSKSVNNASWYTAITEIQPNFIRLRGHNIEQLMGDISFSQAIYLALTGKLSDESIGQILDAILVSSIDHGATPPSTLAARTAASTGAPINAALAAGLLSINIHHGGAIESCMRIIQTVQERQSEQNCSVEEAAASLVREYRQSKHRLAGFGHRIHSADPRAERLLKLASKHAVAAEGATIVQALRDALSEQSGRDFPINVDGAIAAVLLDIGIEAELGNTFFMMARLPGLIAHIREEQSRERPMRLIHPSNHGYDGELH
jgi:succinyl-CoA synthetase alpha subunit